MKTLKQIFLELDKKFRLKKPVSKTDLRTNPGSYTGTGMHTRSYHSDSGAYSTSGAGYSTMGIPGLSKAMGKFDVPPDNIGSDYRKKKQHEKKNIKNKTFLDAEDEIDSYEDLEVPTKENPPVGCPVPALGKADGNRSVGGHGPRHLGHKQR